MKPPKVPQKIKDGIKADLAAAPKGAYIRRNVAEAWGVVREVVDAIADDPREKRDINHMRENVAERSLSLAIVTQEEMLKCLQDEKRMAETPLKDYSRALGDLSSSAVNLLEGHQPSAPVFNFAFIKEQESIVNKGDEYFRRKREEMARQAIEVQPAL